MASSVNAHALGEVKFSTAGSPRRNNNAQRLRCPSLRDLPSAVPGSPKRARMAVLRTLVFQPLPLMTHEISKTTTFLIKSVPQEREVNARQTLELLLRDMTCRFLQ